MTGLGAHGGRNNAADLGVHEGRDHASRLRTLLVSLVALVAVVVVVAGPAATSPAGASTSGWSVNQLYPSRPGAINGVSCPSTAFCVAVGTTSSISGTGYIATSTDGGTTWTSEIAPSGVGSFSGVSCASTSDCVAVGTTVFDAGVGVVATTTDGGTTWTSQTVPSGVSQLNDVSCPSTSTCVAVGDADVDGTTGFIATTDNGGITWASQAVPDGVGGLNDVSCPSVSNCVAVGDSSVSATSFVITSADGGTTWTNRTAPNGAGGLQGVSCSSTLVCVAVGSRALSSDGFIATTSNGGSTWTSETVPSGVIDLVRVSCPSTSSCIAVGTGGSGLASSIVATTNGGATWTNQTAPAEVNSALFGVSCSTATACVIVGQAVSTNGFIASTADGGVTWTSQTVPGGVMTISGISCPTTSNCVTVGQTSTGGAFVATTVNGGITWVDQTVPTGVFELLGVSCPTPSDCVAVGDEPDGIAQRAGVIIATTDGGVTWSVQTVPNGAGLLFGVSCPSPSDCVAVGDGVGQYGFIVTTTDGGATWSSQNVPTDVFDLHGVSCPTTSNCVAVGGTSTGAGYVTSTTDGGSTWTDQLVGGDGLNGVSCPTTSDCVAVGGTTSPAGYVTSTTDGGSTWRNQSVPSGISELLGISCPTSSNCVASGVSSSNLGAIVASTDGGNTWESQTVPAIRPPVGDTVSRVNGASCPSTSSCFAAGQGAEIVGGVVLKDSSLTPTSTAPSAVPDTTTAGSPVAYSATVSGSSGSPTGSVTFSVGSTTLCTATLAGGSGTCRASNAPVGLDTVTATYNGDPTFAGSVGTTTLTVDGAPIFTADTPPTTGLVGETYTYTFAASGYPTPTYALSGAPGWLSINATTGVVSGTPPVATVSLSYSVTAENGVSPDDGAGPYVVTIGTPPVVTGLTVSTGSTLGGTPVTVSGTGLTAATAVDFGSSPATIQGSCTATSCDVLAPAGTPGPVVVTVTTPVATSSTTPTAGNSYTYAVPSEPYHAVAPIRICDTRSGQTKVACPGGTTLGPDGTVTVSAAGNGGVPASGVTAVVVNVTATNTTAQSHLTVFPGGTDEPTASNLNWTANQTIPNLVTVALSPTGTFTAENYAGSADVIFDVEGYYAAGNPGAGLYNALAVPARICDTRQGNPSGLSGIALTQCEGLAPSPTHSLTVTVDSLGGVPTSGVGAVVLNVTAVGATGSGYLTAYPAGQAVPLTSSVNFTAGTVVPNRVIVPVGAGGAVNILSSNGSPNVLVDVAGWFTDGSNASATGTQFTPAATPTRVCDTRTGVGYTTPCTGDTLHAGTTLPVTVAGVDGIPSGAVAVVANVTVANTTATSHLTISPAEQSIPTVSDLNWTAGKNVPNLVIATVGTNGQVNLTNYAGSTDVVVDVVGWMS